MKNKITIFTPTYNRCDLLKNIYKSLCNQTSKNFIWLIIDDGSKDKTEQVVDKFIKEKKIDIKYIKQANGGKYRAHNTAVKNCDSEYFLILDSDDNLSYDAIEYISELTAEISDNDKICGIVGCRFKYDSKEPYYCYLPQIKMASLRELYQLYNFKGDTALLFKTAILKKYLFPEIENEKFMAENVIFDLIGDKYKLLITNHPFYYGEYQEDGYTNNIYKTLKKSPKSYKISLKIAIKYSLKIKYIIRYCIKYIIWCKIYKFKYDLNEFDLYRKVIFTIVYLPSLILYILKKPNNFFR